MFFDVRRKKMGSVIFGDEVEIGDRSRTDSCQKGVFARVTDGGGGKSSNEIGVIRGGSHQMFFGQISIKIFNSIDHRGITLEGNLPFQTIVENGRDERLLFGKRSFFFDDGS
jgi:hypothetical protein